MTGDLSKVYNPSEVEKDISRQWTEAGTFDADAESDKPKFSIVIPPPNVTAVLHLGHALNNTLQDILIRYKRMAGCNTLWMPGTDHAGIATQTVVEKRILAEEGKRRTDFGREEFVERIQDWKDQYERRIINQLKKMGCSCDWRRNRFTMDDICARAVREAFFRLFKEGLIYRGKRLVNWDPATQTVLADDEVEHEQVHGHFWYMRYPLTETVTIEGQKYEHVTVATTRPETMLGDTAVAINPADPRAEYLVGKKVRLPIVGREIQIIADNHVVLPDPESEDERARFSTGFLKVTPAHDPDDYQIGLRHELPMINVMAPDGTISDRHGWEDAEAPEAQNLIGMDRFEAREAVVEFFRTEGLLAEVREYTHQVGHSYRSHVPIEPYLSDQWYVAVKKPIENFEFRNSDFGFATEKRDGVTYIGDTDVPVNSLAGLALAPLLDGSLKFVPDRYARTYQGWLENLRDWPISRQLWWGHRIPIWSGGGNRALDYPDDVLTSRTEQTEEGGMTYVCVAGGNEEIERELVEQGYHRDPDVLDTWFSSALWPISTMGWPEETPELNTFYPTDVLCTAREIITLWVSRMVMFGQYFRGNIPFSDVFIHAMIQDGQGRKMSKSLGNGIDPLDIINSHGADAMRFTLSSMTTQTQDVRMPVEQMTLPDGRKANTSPKFDIGRNFCNKLWNASRFVLMNLEDTPPWSEIDDTAHPADAWILSRCSSAVQNATEAIKQYQFNELADGLYHFMWDDFCDWYVEIAKSRINAGETAPKAILAHVLDTLLRLLHPIVPFITEAIWRRLNEITPARGPENKTAEQLLVRAPWPQADSGKIDSTVDEKFAFLQELIRSVRNIRRQHNVDSGKKLGLIISDEKNDNGVREFFAAAEDVIKSQAEVDKIDIVTDKEINNLGADAAMINFRGISAAVLGAVDIEAEIARLNKQRQKLSKAMTASEGKLSNEQFVSKAPKEVVRRERERLESIKTDLRGVENSLENLRNSGR